MPCDSMHVANTASGSEVCEIFFVSDRIRRKHQFERDKLRIFSNFLTTGTSIYFRTVTGHNMLLCIATLAPVRIGPSIRGDCE